MSGGCTAVNKSVRYCLVLQTVLVCLMMVMRPASAILVLATSSNDHMWAQGATTSHKLLLSSLYCTCSFLRHCSCQAVQAGVLQAKCSAEHMLARQRHGDD